MIPKFQELSKLNISPISYYETLQNLNELLHQDFRSKLSELGNELGEMVTLTVPGSDGRKENASSEFEVIAIYSENCPHVSMPEMDEIIKNSLHKLGIEEIEFKRPGSVLSYYNDNPSIVQPGRIADSQEIVGGSNSLLEIKRKHAEQLIKMESSKIDKVEGLARSARKSIIDGGKNRIGGEDRIHYNLEDGFIFFDPNASSFSFKIGPLRLVQNTILLQQIKKIRRDKTVNMFNELPTGIIPRIKQLKDEGKVALDRDTLSEIYEIYSFFLKIYHRCEMQYRNTGNSIVELSDLGNDMKSEIEKKLFKLVELMKNFKIN